ncbi:chromate efflux transporter [Marispirochaeta aestuarii]|uniref:chromate efflux transporter n=1 Tax=Marispirochaeta aestuarii TaxID=1963862 RepID=UPI0029C66AD1|nr:chromate efflux transporter [Marispirochaeta aestuarii]
MNSDNDNKETLRSSVSYPAFLKDVLICSLGAYGGPEAHLGVFLDRMVTKKRYLKEQDLVELMALCSILPGPTSTQTIVSIGYRMGGRKLAFFTMIVWALPVLFVMGFLSFGYQVLSSMNVSYSILRFIGPMAVGFIIVAALRIGRKVVTDLLSLGLLLSSAVLTFFFRSPWVFPLVLAAGGLISILIKREKGMWNPVQIRPPWGYLVLFAALAVGGLAAASLTDFRLLENFERFYRYGYLVFGGGQVVVPVMYGELVDIRQFMTGGEFLTGYGLVQGLPGPMFSFAAYAGGMASRGEGILIQALGAAIGGIGIFLPGLLLIYFVYPLWEDLKQIRAIRLSLAGINAVAGGLIAVAAVILTLSSGISLENLTVTAASALLLGFTKIPPPLIVLAAFGLGIIL